jgi:hypothetical protein
MRPFTTWSFEHLISGFNQPTTLRLSSRHCERSETIHSSFARRDGLLRGACHRARIRATRWLAMTWDCRREFVSRGAMRPRLSMKSLALRGRGERRMPLAPAASCALGVVEDTRVTTSTPESPGVPARNGFNGFLRALLGDRALLPPSPHGYPAHPNPVGRLHLRKT